MTSFMQKLTRRKYVTFDNSELTRVLTLLDLILLGVGSTVGVGFYILAGAVARDTAGPAVVVSFLIAAVASIFAGLCYAEFGARVPKAGSAYIYSYVCVGEFVSFVIGWNLILEYVIGTASVARGYSAYVDELVNNKLSAGLENAMPMDISWLSPYPDFFAFTITMLLTVIISVGVKASTRFNNVFTGVNLFVVLYVIVAGLFQFDAHNWFLTEEEVGYNSYNATVCIDEKYPDRDPERNEWGKGGFAPYGIEGIMQGAATCFFGFVGFDVIATTGEEAIRPERNLPVSIATSLLIVFLAYFGMSCVITFALPYCLQDSGAPLIYLFDYYEMIPSKWIVSTGAIFGFSASLLGVIFPMPRIIYAMASDGLLFKFLAKVSKRFQTPVRATILSGFLAACMALVFSLNSLIDMMSIGTLLAYTIVALCVMLLRYSEDAIDEDKNEEKHEKSQYQTGEFFKERHSVFTASQYFGQVFNAKKVTEPTELTSTLVNYLTISFAILALLLDLVLVIWFDSLSNGDAGAIVVLCCLVILVFINAFAISRQPESKKVLSFKVPFVPWIPALSTVINLYLMCNLSSATWIRFGIWMAIGLLIYFLYGIRKSTEGFRLKGLLQDIKQNDKLIIPPIYVFPPTPMPPKHDTTNSLMIIKEENTDQDPSLTRTDIANDMAKTDKKEDNIKEESYSGKTDNGVTMFADIVSEKYNKEEDSNSENHSVNNKETKFFSNNAENKTISDSNPDLYENKEKNGLSSPSLNDTGDENSFRDLTKVNDTYIQKSSDDMAVNNINDSEKMSEMKSVGLYLDRDTGIEQKENEGMMEVTKSEVIVEGMEKIKIKEGLYNSAYEIDEDIFQKPLKTWVSDDNLAHVPVGVTQSFPSEVKNKNVPPTIRPLLHSQSMTNLNHQGSLPNTPRAQRHPYKVFKRVASFESIPPSSPDSPFAKRIILPSRKVFVIPVDDQAKESDMVIGGDLHGTHEPFIDNSNGLNGTHKSFADNSNGLNGTHKSFADNSNGLNGMHESYLDNMNGTHQTFANLDENATFKLKTLNSTGSKPRGVLSPEIAAELNKKLNIVRSENEMYEITGDVRLMDIEYGKELDTIRERSESKLSTDDENYSRRSSINVTNGLFDKGNLNRASTRLSTRSVKPAEKDIKEVPTSDNEE